MRAGDEARADVSGLFGSALALFLGYLLYASDVHLQHNQEHNTLDNTSQV
jgi:hypothetical protein